MDWLKTISGKVISGVVVLAVGAGGLAWYETPAPTRSAIVSLIGRVIGWFVVVAVVPWAGFALVGRVAKMESNVAGGVLIIGLTILEAVLLGWLFGPSGFGKTAWVMFAAAVAVAGVYNLFACDWIAEKVE